MREEERLSIDEIKAHTGLSVGTISALLRDHPLTKKEIRQKMSESSLRNNPLRRYDPEQSKFALAVEGQELNRERKGHIAEAAVLFRLTLLGYEAWRSSFEGSRVDFMVSRPGVNKQVRLQVRWATRGGKRASSWGRPDFMVNKSRGEPMDKAVCDFIVGYDLETDTAFVLPIEECGKWWQSCGTEYAEAWHLLGI